MADGKIGVEALAAYRASLRAEERSGATVEKYLRDAQRFYQWLPEPKEVTKAAVVSYKEVLSKRYTARSVNAMLAGVNHFLRFLGQADCAVKTLRTQRRSFSAPERELTKAEYRRLLSAAERRQSWRLLLIMEAICSTGIRVSELCFLTVEAARQGRADVDCKGKVRTILLPHELRKKLLHYARRRGLVSGPVFVTRTGRPVDRSNIWSDMKKLCAAAGVAPEKVFPHNLRHLFARTFYALEKDLGRLADLLGHSSIETTRIYTMTSGMEQAARLDALGLLMPPCLRA